MAYTEKAKQLTGFIKKAGDVMTGFLTLHADPTANMHAATKQYVDNKTGMELLWTNASPTSAFAAQTISVDLSKGELFLMKIKYNTVTNWVIYLLFMSNENGSIFKVNPAVSPYKYDILLRDFEVSGNKITFTDCQHANAQEDPNTANSFLIPWRVYRIK